MVRILFILLICSSAFGQAFTLRDPGLVGNAVPKSSGMPSGDLMVETFEGANSGYDLAGWSQNVGAGSTVDPDYASTNIGDSGSQSFHFIQAGNGASSVNTVSSSTEVSIRLKVRPISNSTSLEVINGVNGASVLFSVFISTDTHIKAIDVGNNAIVDGGLASLGTTYYVWVHYLKGTGANAHLDIAFSTTSTRPAYVSTTAGGSTLNCDRIRLGNNNPRTGEAIVDDVNVFAGNPL